MSINSKKHHIKKKIITLTILLSMLICNSTGVYAANYTWDNNTNTDVPNQDITGYIGVDNSASPMCVEITWGNFAYTYDGKVQWDSSGKYVPTGSVTGWTSTSEATQITVVNKSCKDVEFCATFTSDTNNGIVFDTNNALTAKFYKGDVSNEVFQSDSTLEVSSPTLDETNSSAVVGIKITGLPTTVPKDVIDDEDGCVLGTVTVQIDEAEE